MSLAHAWCRGVETAHKPFTVGLLVSLVACAGSVSGGPADGEGGAGGGGGDGPPEERACEEQKIAPRIWRLTPEQYKRTVNAAFGLNEFDAKSFPADPRDAKTGFANGAQSAFLGGPLTNAVFNQTELFAAKAVKALSQRTPCMLASSVSESCVKDFVGSVGKRAFRRPLSAEEQQRFVDLHKAKVGTLKAQGAAELLVQALLMSPHMLYRFELGNGEAKTKLDNYEIASALSYGLTDRPPSDELLAAAEEGRLSDPKERESFAKGLVKTDEARTKFAQFLYWQMGLYKLEDKRNDLGDGLVNSAIAEVDAFAKDVLQSSEPTLTTLYKAPVSFVDSNLAPAYGVGGGTELKRTQLKEGERFGVFTQPGWLMATHGPIHRGKVIREMFLCQGIPLPPPNAGDLIMQLPQTPKEWTQREKWDVFVQERGGCAACHRQFEPLGFPFERYDDKGKFRSENEYGRAIATDGEIEGANDWSGKFDGLGDLVDQILASPSGRNCFVQRYMTYVMGTTIEDAESSCMTRDVGRKFANDGLNIEGLMVAGVTDEGFVSRAR
ncbi:MAG: DUF1588 domain-containing protein [Deltaproteobacteria bacterium]|nr:DUF1588 domain-containing protein [Deltaproteobacteria bacterium]